MLPQENMQVETDDATVDKIVESAVDSNSSAGVRTSHDHDHDHDPDTDTDTDDARSEAGRAAFAATSDAGERRIGERRTAGERRSGVQRRGERGADEEAIGRKTDDAGELGSRIVMLEAQVKRQAELLEMVSDPEALKRRVELQLEVEKLEGRLKEARKQKKAAERQADTAQQEAKSLRSRHTAARSTIDKLLDDDTSPGRIRAALRDLFSDSTV